MNIKKNYKKSLAALLVSGLVVGGAFAVLTASDVDSNTQTITTGTFEVKFANEGNGFADMAAFPRTREQAVTDLSASAYKFSVTNNGTIDAVAKLGAINIATLTNPEGASPAIYSSELLPKDKVHVIIQDVTADESVGIAALNDASIVYEGTLADLEASDSKHGATALMHFNAGASKTFKMIVYIDNGADNAILYGADTLPKTATFTLKAFYAQEDGGIFEYSGNEISGGNAWESIVTGA